MNFNLREKSLALVTYSAITREGNDILVNRAFGLLIDDLAKAFSRIYYIGAEENKSSGLYREGKSIYKYCIKSENVSVIPIHPTGHIANPVKRIRRMMTNQGIILRILNDADYVYIFLPGYTGLVSAFDCLLRRKPYFLYFGSDWQETAGFRVPSEVKKDDVAFLCAREFYVFVEKIIVRKAMFCLSAGRNLTAIQGALNIRSFETVPMVQFRSSENLHEGTAVASIGEKDLRVFKMYNDHTVHILSVGNVKESKGTIYLLNALPHLLSNGIDVRVTLVGAIDETYRAYLLEEMAKSDTMGRVSFTGYVNDVEQLQQHYNEAEVFVLPTLGEGFPRVLYEAMMSGLPVVASDIDSIRENVQGSEAISLVKPKDPKAIAAAVMQLMQNQTLRKRRVDAGYRFAVSKFHTNPAEQVICLLEEYATDGVGVNRP